MTCTRLKRRLQPSRWKVSVIPRHTQSLSTARVVETALRIAGPTQAFRQPGDEVIRLGTRAPFERLDARNTQLVQSLPWTSGLALIRACCEPKLMLHAPSEH